MLALLPSCGDEAKEPLVYSTIHEAAAKDNLADVKRHLAKGVAVNARDGDDATPLHCAAEKGHKDVVEYLIAKGADVNARTEGPGWTPPGWPPSYYAAGSGWTPLHLAAREGHKDVVEYLIAKGADVNAKDGMDLTPLQWAAGKGHKDVVEILKRHGGSEVGFDQKRAFLEKIPRPRSEVGFLEPPPDPSPNREQPPAEPPVIIGD